MTLLIDGARAETKAYFDTLDSPEARSEKEPFEILRDALKSYVEADGVNEREDFLGHAERTVNLVCAIMWDVAPKETYYAALLHDLADRMLEEGPKNTPPRQIAAARALFEIFTNPAFDFDQGDYLKRLLGDMPFAEESSAKHRKDMAQRQFDSDYGDPLKSAGLFYMLADSYNGVVPPVAFTEIQPILDFEHMSEFLAQTYLEALIIKSAELYDNMRFPSSARQSARLQDALEAESFCGPICELMDLDGLAEMLYGQARIVRLEGRGEQAAVENALEMVNELRGLGPEKLLKTVFGDHEFAVSHAVGREGEEGAFPIYIGNFVSNDNSGNWRIKSEGSCAEKMLGKYKGEKPLDLFGVTVVSEDNICVADSIINYIEERADSVEFKKAPGKKGAIYVQGSTNYVKYIKRRLNRAIKEGRTNISLDDVEFKSQSPKEAKKEGFAQYEVSKITLVTTDNESGVQVPTEIQYLTKAERERAKIGETSHVLYNYKRSMPGRPTTKDVIETNGEFIALSSEIQRQRSRIRPDRLLVGSGPDARGDKLIQRMLELIDKHGLTD